MKRRTFVVAGILDGYEIREELLEGRPHIVIPTVSMVEGVHNRLFYPGEEFALYPGSWDGEPVVVQHPVEDGTPVSANSPTVYEEVRIGQLFTTAWDEEGKKLKHEVWVDVAQASRLAPKVLAALRNRERLEVSTGLWGDEDGVPGIWNGEEYDSTIRNYRPDHLALLPGGVGACSWADGCGIRANEEENMNKGVGPVVLAMVDTLRKNGFAVLEMGHDEIHRRLQGKVDALDTSLVAHYVEEVYADVFVYRAVPKGESPSGEERTYSRGYTVAGGETDVALSTEIEEVVKKTEYVTANDAARVVGDEGGKEVKKEEIIRSLVANEATRFEEKDAEWLKDLTEEQLDSMAPIDEEEEKPEGGEEKPKGAEAPEGEEEKPKGTEAPEGEEEKPKEEDIPAPATAEEYVNAAPPEFRDVLTNGLDLMTAKRKHLIDGIVKNAKGVFTETELKDKPIKELEKLAKMADVPEDYSGRIGANRVVENEEDDQPPVPPRVFVRKENK